MEQSRFVDVASNNKEIMVYLRDLVWEQCRLLPVKITCEHPIEIKEYFSLYPNKLKVNRYINQIEH